MDRVSASRFSFPHTSSANKIFKLKMNEKKFDQKYHKKRGFELQKFLRILCEDEETSNNPKLLQFLNLERPYDKILDSVFQRTVETFLNQYKMNDAYQNHLKVMEEANTMEESLENLILSRVILLKYKNKTIKPILLKTLRSIVSKYVKQMHELIQEYHRIDKSFQTIVSMQSDVFLQSKSRMEQTFLKCVEPMIAFYRPSLEAVIQHMGLNLVPNVLALTIKTVPKFCNLFESLEKILFIDDETDVSKMGSLINVFSQIKGQIIDGLQTFKSDSLEALRKEHPPMDSMISKILKIPEILSKSVDYMMNPRIIFESIKVMATWRMKIENIYDLSNLPNLLDKFEIEAFQQFLNMSHALKLQLRHAQSELRKVDPDMQITEFVGSFGTGLSTLWLNYFKKMISKFSDYLIPLSRIVHETKWSQAVRDCMNIGYTKANHKASKQILVLLDQLFYDVQTYFISNLVLEITSFITNDLKSMIELPERLKYVMEVDHVVLGTVSKGIRYIMEPLLTKHIFDAYNPMGFQNITLATSSTFKNRVILEYELTAALYEEVILKDMVLQSQKTDELQSSIKQSNESIQTLEMTMSPSSEDKEGTYECPLEDAQRNTLPSGTMHKPQSRLSTHSYNLDSTLLSDSGFETSMSDSSLTSTDTFPRENGSPRTMQSEVLSRRKTVLPKKPKTNQRVRYHRPTVSLGILNDKHGRSLSEEESSP